ncbi:uncharacterized protein LOC114284289 [Camellia sinensis]|uniref:uncharacterized protein LOC114284289 n=1 Tax=Camellia sinensis TaxID=4442 RepID=UPI0010362AE5|nr:uncharacterized protein LOC114284289 [Camellia sinensis]
MDVAELHDIVIVGGRICGLATALALHRKGMTSIVLERAETLRTIGAGIGMQSNGWLALDQLGVGLKLRQTVIPVLRYTAPRRSGVTDFLRAPSPPHDPTLLDVPLIRLIEEEEMGKGSRIKNLVTAMSTEVPSIPHHAPAASQTFGMVIALASTAAAQTSKESRGAGKGPRSADPIAELIVELSAEQPANTSEPMPPWKPQLKHWGKEILANTSVKGDNEHLLAFDLTKALLLPSDVTDSDHVPDTRLVKSLVKSMTRVRISHV